MDNEKCRELIQLYEQHRLLWDPKEENYHNSTFRKDAWKEISLILKITVAELRTKMKTLKDTYRREKSRQKRSQTGSGNGSVYTSKWFAFNYFGFLDDRNNPNPTINTLSEEVDMPEYATDLSKPTQVDGLTASEPSTSMEWKRKTSGFNETSIPIKKKKVAPSHFTTEDDAVLMKSISIFQQSVDAWTNPYFSYAQNVANELKKYDDRTLAIVKQSINNIIFDADIGRISLLHDEYLQGYSSPTQPSSAGTSPHYTRTLTPLPSSGTMEPSPHSEINKLQSETQNAESGDDNTNIFALLEYTND